MMTSPVTVYPVCQAVQYDGTNAQDIADWLALDLADVQEGYALLALNPDELIGVGVSDWVLATMDTPPRYTQVVGATSFPGQYAPVVAGGA